MYLYGLNLGSPSVGPSWTLGPSFEQIVKNHKAMIFSKGLRALRPFFGPHLRSKYESGNKRISLHDFIRPIFLVFHFGFSLDLAMH